jgi:NADH-quinone oxidoreductase subunit E
MTFVATSLGISPARVFGVASFYAHFTLQPKGKYVLRFCDGTACHVKGSEPILKAVQDKLGLCSRKPTSDDLMFTIETVSCLGACGLAPVMVVNEKVYGQVGQEQALEIVDGLFKKEAEHANA